MGFRPLKFRPKSLAGLLIGFFVYIPYIKWVANTFSPSPNLMVFIILFTPFIIFLILNFIRVYFFTESYEGEQLADKLNKRASAMREFKERFAQEKQSKEEEREAKYQEWLKNRLNK